MSTLLGTYTNATFGCTAESGILVTSVNINATADKVEVRDGDGDVALVSFYNQRSTVALTGTVSGTPSTGINAAVIGNALTIANLQSVGGVSAGVCLVDSVSISKKNNGFTDISVTATRYPNITSTLSGSTTVTGGTT